MNNKKVSVGITTFNSEDAFKALYDSLPFHKINEIVVVNGGSPYVGDYPNVNWIQHTENKFPAQSRNDCLIYLQDKEPDNIFIIEDDMKILSENVFDEYINASIITGLEYFCYASYAWESGPKNARTPKLQVGYSPTLNINLYSNMCNEFTFRTKSLHDKVGLYDVNIRKMFDVDMAYRYSLQSTVSPFWYFADLAYADTLITNNEDVLSRIDPNGNRWDNLQHEYEYFRNKHGVSLQQVQSISKDAVIHKLKNIKHENNNLY